MKSFIKSLVLIVAFLLQTSISFAQADIITAKDFMKTIKDKNTIALSLQSMNDYETAHIHHSIFLDHKKLFEEGRTEIVLKSPEEIAKILGEIGISNINNIIVYDEAKLKYAGRVYWILKYLGVESVRLLEKDWEAWKAARIPLTKRRSKRTATKFIPKVSTDIIIDIPWIESHVTDGKVVLVDILEEKEREKERKIEREKEREIANQRIAQEEWNRRVEANRNKGTSLEEVVLGITTVLAVTAVAVEGLKAITPEYSGNDGSSSDVLNKENNSPCYEIIDDYGYMIDNSKRYYTVKCKDESEEKITFNSDLDEPYRLSFDFSGYKSLHEAAKKACGCN